MLNNYLMFPTLAVIRKNILSLLFCIPVFLGVSCTSKKEEKTLAPEAIIYKIDTSKAAPLAGQKPPIINITDTVAPKQIVLYMKDSARSSERIGIKLTNIYDKVLADVISKNKLTKTGARIAWYKNSSAPFFFEAGIPINKKPAKLPKNVFVKTIGGDSAVVAHFYGPYALTYEGYGALREWLTDNKRKSKGAPYEVYVGEMIDSLGKAKDPYRVQTDIVFPHH
jgi:effector-binding domain-containing protein